MRVYQASYSTVTRALKELRGAGVIERVWGKGTFVLQQRQASANVAVTFGLEHLACDAYLRPILNGIMAMAPEFEFDLQIFALPECRIFGERQGSLLSRLLREKEIAGVIACDPHPPQEVSELLTLGVPVVSILNEYPGLRAAAVMDDTDRGARIVADFLCKKLKHRDVRLVMGPVEGHTARLRRSSTLLGEAMVRELRRYGVRCGAASMIQNDFSWEESEPVLRSWLTSARRPTALVVCSDLLALRTVELARSLGIAVPEQLSVVGWGDVLDHSPITSVRVPMQGMGQKAVDLLQARITGQRPKSVKFPVALIVRSSTAKTACM